MKGARVNLLASLCGGLLLLAGCSPGPQAGSQTNWLSPCVRAQDCGELLCICGVCTSGCSAEADCAAQQLGECVPMDGTGAIAACDGHQPRVGMCLQTCDGASCPAGTECVAGSCLPSSSASATVTVEPSTTHQTLLGFGASLAYDDDLIVSQQDKAALYDALFANSGLTMLRLRNRFEGNNLDQLDAAAEIVAEATKRIGHAPTLFMTSGTPPAALKANGRRFCANADADCTLAQAAGGGFDYAGFAEFWRGSLEAYESVGIHPDFVSIQNNPDYIPPDATALEACRFLPVEGTSVVTTPDGQTVTAPFPGYSEALSAVQSAVSSVGDYAFAAAEAGSLVMTSRYEELAPATYQALAYHLYGTQVSDVDLAGLQALRSYGQQTGRPVIQSEMPAPGFDTAVLAHYSLTVADAAAYLQQTLVGSDFGEGAMTLFAIDGKSFARLPAYHALAHFARFTAPGWRRVEAGSDDTHLLVSAWSPPDGSALTVVLINTGSDAVDAEVTVSGNAAALLAKAQVTRTVFDGVERSANLGALSSEHIVRVPGRAIVTVSSKAN